MRKNQITNEMKIILPSFSINESITRSIVAAFIAHINPTAVELADIKCAVSEAITNCIVHGYRNEIGNIYITVKILDNNTVKIIIKDKGCGIPDIKKARQPLFTTDSENERSGMGFTVMESFMDKLSVRSEVGKGTTVTMSKKINDLHIT